MTRTYGEGNFSYSYSYSEQIPVNNGLTAYTSAHVDYGQFSKGVGLGMGFVSSSETVDSGYDLTKLIDGPAGVAARVSATNDAYDKANKMAQWSYSMASGVMIDDHPETYFIGPGELKFAKNLLKSGFSTINRTAATSYLRYTRQLDNFASVDGFSFGIGLQQRYIYHNSMGAAMNSRWFTSTRYASPGGAFNGLGLDYFGSQNFAQNMYGFRNFGFSVKGTAASQGMSFGGGVQYFRTGLSFGTKYTPIGY